MTKPISLSFEQVVTDMREIVSARPDYVYRAPEREISAMVTCVYFDEVDEDIAVPSCVVGHFLAKHGVTREDLRVKYRTHRDDLNEGASVKALYDGGIIDKTADAGKSLSFLQLMQSRQDSGHTWQDAFDFAIGEGLVNT